MKFGLLLLVLVVTATASTAPSAASSGSSASVTASSGSASVASGGSSVASSGSAAASSSAASSGAVAPVAATCSSLSAPSNYSRNLRYVILVGCAGFFLVGIVFFLLSTSESGNKIVHVLTFFATIIVAFGYFSIWEGIGADYKEALDHSCRLIFHGRLYTLFVSLPIVITAFILFSRVEHGAIIGGIGAAVIAVFAWTLGSTVQGPQKYVWWTIGLLFAIAEIVHLFAVSSASKRALTANGATVANVVFVVISGSLIGYAVIWIVGATGTGYLSPATELAWYVALDTFVHIGVGFALVTSGEAILEGSFVPLLSEAGPNFHQAYGSGATASYMPPGFPASHESRQYV